MPCFRNAHSALCALAKGLMSNGKTGIAPPSNARVCSTSGSRSIRSLAILPSERMRLTGTFVCVWTSKIPIPRSSISPLMLGGGHASGGLCDVGTRRTASSPINVAPRSINANASEDFPAAGGPSISKARPSIATPLPSKIMLLATCDRLTAQQVNASTSRRRFFHQALPAQ